MGGIGLAVNHGVPNKFARARPGEVTNIGGGEAPCFRTLGLGLLVFGRFFRGDDEAWGIVAYCLQALLLSGTEHLFGILQHASRADHLVIRYGQ